MYRKRKKRKKGGEWLIKVTKRRLAPRNILGRRWTKTVISFICVLMGISIIYSIVGQKGNDDKLQVYTKSDRVAHETKDETKKTDIKTEDYTDSDYGFSTMIPEGWKKITKDGYTTFVHQQSGTSVQFQTLAYDPQINNMDEETASDEAAKAGNTFVSFTKKDDWNSRYQYLYQKKGDVTYDYVDDVHWTRQHIVKIECIYNDAYHEKISPYISKILDSFEWSDDADIIPEKYKLFYIDSSYFEFGVPIDWTISSQSGTISAVNSDQSATETISVQNNTAHLKDVTQTDLVSYIKQDKSSFILQSCDKKSDDEYAVKYTYMNGDKQMSNITYVHSNGYAFYYFSFDYIDGSFDTSTAEQCDALFREFFSDKTKKEKKQIEDQEKAAAQQSNAQYQQTESDSYN